MCFATICSMHISNGKSPVNQPESETRLRERIHDQLKRHGRVDASKFGIVVRKGQVLLWGSVGSERERTTAAEIAADIAGRLNVINHIHVFQTLG
jgi:osmotically-inducible protein OsmY